MGTCIHVTTNFISFNVNFRKIQINSINIEIEKDDKVKYVIVFNTLNNK